MDELHNHIHSAVNYLERENVESYLCVCVLVYIYEFIFHSSMDQNIVDFVLLIFFGTLHYFTWSM